MVEPAKAELAKAVDKAIRTIDLQSPVEPDDDSYLKERGLTPIKAVNRIEDWDDFLASVDKMTRGTGKNRRVMFAFWHLGTDNKLVLDWSTFEFPYASFNEAMVLLHRQLTAEAERK